MATNGSLNDMEQWRSVVEYRNRKANPGYHYRDNRDAPAYLDEWSEETRFDVRGPTSLRRTPVGRPAETP